MYGSETMLRSKMFSIVIVFFFCSVCNGELKLKQVLALGRHNIRAALTDKVTDITPNTWPSIDAQVGHLTAKGWLMEQYMGDYFFDWLSQEKVIEDSSGDNNVVYVHANTKPRTRDSAKAFISGKFKTINVSVHLNKELSRNDPIFNPVLHNTTTEFKDIALQEMQTKLEALNSTTAFLTLNEILNFTESTLCKNQMICDLASAKSKIELIIGKEPFLLGPYGIGATAVDIFLISYAEGVPLQKIGWGKVTKREDLKQLTSILRGYQHVRYNSTAIAMDTSHLLMKHMAGIFLNENEEPKFTLLMGHDSNLYPIMCSLMFKAYELTDQYEQTPLGGKLTFQKWFDSDTESHLLKVEFIYQSMDQLRNGTKLSFDHPPQRTTMELKNCKINNEGFCLWEDFIKIVKSVLAM